MFYCEECRRNNDLNEGIFTSYGPCEVCKEIANCHDVPSSHAVKRTDTVINPDGTESWKEEAYAKKLGRIAKER